MSATLNNHSQVKQTPQLESDQKPRHQVRQHLGDEGLLNEFQLAEAININVKTLRRWRLFGRGPHFIKVGGTLVRYPVSGVRAWLEAQPTGGTEADAR